MLASRGEMDEDPLLFGIRSATSRRIGFAALMPGASRKPGSAIQPHILLLAICKSLCASSITTAPPPPTACAVHIDEVIKALRDRGNLVEVVGPPPMAPEEKSKLEGLADFRAGLLPASIL